ncbi:MAG: group II intron reverse transcriptase/maturase [Chitinophagaceae bacterium]|nr:MAG: group II intron reverse transcriptase/maturase [Chitinophagaceae bacterium]
MLNEGTTDSVTLEAVLSKENMQAAWKAVKANGGAAGVDGMGIGASERHLREHWDTIEARLLSGQYVPGAVRAVEIPKPNGGVRMLGIPNVVDRTIEQAIHQVLSPVWEPHFSEYSFGFRPGRRAQDAVEKARGYILAGKKWVVDIDLRSFFDRVNHDKLMSLVARKVRDKRLLRLIGEYLRAPMQKENGSREKRRQGTPQGSPLSPLLANIYLDPLDKELEKRGLSFVRYADDIAIFASSQRAAERILASVMEWIEKELKVEVNRDKSGVGPSDKGSLLGFRLYGDGKVGVSPKAVERMKERVKELWKAKQSRTSLQLRKQWQSYIRGWWSYFEYADWRREVENTSGWIRRHMRKCFWKRWHSAKGRLNALQRLGVRGRALGNAYSRRGAWHMGRHHVTHQALKNSMLNRYGFIIPWDLAKAQA